LLIQLSLPNSHVRPDSRFPDIASCGETISVQRAQQSLETGGIIFAKLES
jgi:hypothetical protein